MNPQAARRTRLLSISLLIALALAPLRANENQLPAEPTDPVDTVLHPSALVRLIDEIGGRRVKVVKAKVIAVLNPRAILIQSAAALEALPGNYDRVLVLIDEGALRVQSDDIVDTNVRVNGIARTLLGLQTTKEVPWPPELTKDVLKRYEIRAAVLARSVQTADGVELTDRR
jgi:hypothetical protein